MGNSPIYDDTDAGYCNRTKDLPQLCDEVRQTPASIHSKTAPMHEYGGASTLNATGRSTSIYGSDAKP